MIENAQNGVEAALEEIERLMQSEFPSLHPKDAIIILKKEFEIMMLAFKTIKTGLHVPPDAVPLLCSSSRQKLFDNLPILGFILRSTNVRNGFEAYGPLLHLAELLMGPETKLIVSSEWEFSPFVYRAIIDLPGFVLIGLPATESSNPLVIPLAGHELGHSVWAACNFAGEFNSRIRQRVLREITDNKWDDYMRLFPQYDKKQVDETVAGQGTWGDAYNWAVLQAEEIFCDFFGLRLFAESYLHAFDYLISPGTSGLRSMAYPNLKDRVAYLVKAANYLGVIVPDHFYDRFIPEDEPFEPRTAFLVAVADTVSRSYVTDLLIKATYLADEREIPTRNRERMEHIATEFKDWVVPTREAEMLVDISCAGWQCKLDGTLWKHFPQIEKKDWNRILQDIMYKSMEVSEIHVRLEKAARKRLEEVANKRLENAVRLRGSS